MHGDFDDDIEIVGQILAGLDAVKIHDIAPKSLGL
jgi:hypothetical protein